MKIPKVYEPTTVITDLILALMGFVFGYHLLLIYGERGFDFHFYWAWGFIVTGLGAFFGATSHGFGPHFTTLIKNILWKGTMLFIGLSGWFFAMGTAIFILSPSVFDLVRWILIVSIIVYMVYVFRDDRFIIAIRYYFPLMIFIMLEMLYQFSIGYSMGSAYVAVGVLVSLAGAGVKASEFSIHEHFNHNDLFHVIQMMGMIFMYLGGLDIGMYVN